MKNYIALFLTFCLSFVLINSTYALEKITNFNSIDITENSITLSWDNQDDIIYSEINYWVKSIDEEEYSLIKDLIEWNSITIWDLEENTSYYFSITWANELWEYSEISDELTVTTLSKELIDLEELTLVDALIYDKNKVKLFFTNELEDFEWVIREFKVTWINDEFDTFEVVDTELVEDDKSSLIITLDWEPTIWNEYKVVALEIRDIFNQNIEFWDDAIAVFLAEEIIEMPVEELIVEDEIIEETSTWVVEDEIIQEELNSAEDKEPTNVWVDLTEEEIEDTVLNVADDVEKLPQTWPEQILIFILAFILWALVFVFRFKRS